MVAKVPWIVSPLEESELHVACLDLVDEIRPERILDPGDVAQVPHQRANQR